jgi:hypothetical protein
LLFGACPILRGAISFPLERAMRALGFGLGFGRSQQGSRGAEGAVLDLDYVTGRCFGRRLADHVCGRGSSAFTPDAAGTWIEVPPETLRRTDAGLLAEYGAVNALRNNWLAGAAAGEPGRLPAGWTGEVPTGTQLSVEEVATVRGLPAIALRLVGVATGGRFRLRFGAPSDIAAAPGQNWVFSAFLQRLARTNLLDLRLTLEAVNGSGIVLGTGDTGNIADRIDAWSRPFGRIVGTPAGTAKMGAALESAQDFSGSVTLDERIRIAAPQVESWDPLLTDTPFPTSPIRTNGTAAARSGEYVGLSLDGLGLTKRFTCVVVAEAPPEPRKTATFVEFNSGYFAKNILGLRLGSDPTRLELHVRGLDEEAASFVHVAAPPPGRLFCAAFTTDGNALALSANGADAASGPPGKPIMDGYPRLNVGGMWSGVHQAHGAIKRVVVFPFAVPPTELPANAAAARWGF